MVEIHATYDRVRYEKLRAMFGSDPRQGNHALYVKEHFDLKRSCGNCAQRSNSDQIAVPSVLLEGDSWVLPISVQVDGKILIDLEGSIPDQSIFFTEEIIAALPNLGIACLAQGQIEYIVPIASGRDEYYRTIRKNEYQHYNQTRKRFRCEVLTNVTADDVLKWDAELQYDFERRWSDAAGACGFNVEIEYFQWLAQNRQLVLARISNENDETLALCYCVPGDYELYVVNYKRRIAERYAAYGLGKSLIFMLLDHVYDNHVLTPLNLGNVLYNYKEIWRPIPAAVRPQLVFSNRAAQEALVSRFRAG